MDYSISDALTELFSGVSELTKDLKVDEDFSLSSISPEMDAKLKDLAQGVSKKIFASDEKLSEMYSEHEKYHTAGASALTYSAKPHKVHAIQYQGKSNLNEVIDFLTTHEMSFAMFKGHLGLIGGTPDNMEIETVNDHEWIVFRPEIDCHTVLPCRDFAVEYDIPVEKFEDKSDEPFEGSNSDELFDES